MSEIVRYETRGDVALITYDNQPKRNALGLAMYRAIVAAVERANSDDAVGAIVVTHDGPVFCSGADLREPPQPPDPVTGKRTSAAMESMADDTSWLHLLARSKPNIVAVRGKAIGMGATQLLAFDLRVGAEGSSYSFPFLSLGTMPELGASALLPRIVGFGRAMDICMNARTLSAAEALNAGLITSVFPDDALVDEALKMAARMAQYDRLGVSLTKNMFYGNADEADTNALLKRERDAFVTMARARRAANQKIGLAHQQEQQQQ
ncbi:MAG: enoyl-CoA hydratase/isomerase family protein [Caulobacterales bacterium]